MAARRPQKKRTKKKAKGRVLADRVQLIYPDGPVGCTFLVWLYIDPPPDGDVCITLEKVIDTVQTRPVSKLTRAGGIELGFYYADLFAVPFGEGGAHVLSVCLTEAGVSCEEAEPGGMECYDFTINIDCS